MTGLMSSENWIGALPPEVRTAIEGRMSAFVVPAGAMLKDAGDAPTAVYQVQAGFLRLLGLHRDGQQTLIQIYRAGNSFGETAIVARRPFNHTTVALTEVHGRALLAADFWDLYHRHPEIPEALCRKFATIVSRQFEMRELLATHRLGTLVALFFKNLADYCGEPDGTGEIHLGIPLTQSDMAEHLGVTRQGVQREIGVLKRAALIAKRNSRWSILDIERLKNV